MHGYLFSRIDTSISYVIGPSYSLKFGAICYCDNYFILSVDKYWNINNDIFRPSEDSFGQTLHNDIWLKKIINVGPNQPS